MELFDNVRIVLVNTSHAGNIGATARAMKNMGFAHLCLVSPETFPHQQATVRAAGADDILANATVVNDLASALGDCERVFALSARARTLPWPICNPRQCAVEIHDRPRRKVALVFGRERTGLTNEELSYCHKHVYIPARSDFSSLNLAAAVQIMAYEIRMTGAQEHAFPSATPLRELASAEQLHGYYQHLATTLTRLHFLDPKQPKMLMQRLKRLFNRAQLDSTEINILRGILSAIDRLT